MKRADRGDLDSCKSTSDALLFVLLTFVYRTFADPDNVSRALENCPHTLDGRTIDPK
jgi:hypothetical protein